MTRQMYDGIDANRLPISAQIVAGYVDGLYRWSDANWARFPHSVKVRVAVFSQTNDGQVLDVEPGNATPAQSVDWVLMRRRAGVDPTIYMNTSTWPVVRSAFRARGVPEPHYWVAQYDNAASIPSGAIAKQYYNNNDLGYDLSIVADHWPGIDPDPAPEAEMTPQDIAALLNQPVARAGGPTGNTSLAGLIAWNDAHVQHTLDALAELAAKLDTANSALSTLKLGGIDIAQLEALIEQHIAAGSLPNVIAAAVLHHLSAATAGATP